jgi:hypothetical protein
MRRLLFVAALALAAWPVVGAQSAWQLTPASLASPAPPNSAQPQLSVSSRGVLLSWIERNGDLATLRFAERSAAGWTEPRTVASGRDWFVNWADVPSVLRLPSGTLAAHWLQKSGTGTYAYDVRLSYSVDDGKTWAPSFLPHHDNAKAEHGFASLFPVGDGLGLVWLDGRAMKSGHDEHAGGADAGAMSVRYAQFDRNWKQVVDTQVDGRVCECCPTTAVVTADGVIAAFRNRSEDEIRDIYVARMQNGKWSDSAPVFSDNWKIAACPVNGPSLSASGAAVAISWFTAKGDEGRAFAAFSRDSGRTFGAPIRLDETGTLGRVDMDLLPDGSAMATWIEFAEQRAQIRVRRIERSGALSKPTTIAGIAGSRASGYPRTAIAGHEAVFAWTESGAGGALQVRTAVAGIP